MILALCHKGTTNKRYSKSKGNCQARDRSEVLQGMTPGCSLCTTGHIKTLFLSFPFLSISLCYCISTSKPSLLYFISVYQSLVTGIWKLC